nr:unnamed protein product [Digitaria exilis]
MDLQSPLHASAAEGGDGLESGNASGLVRPCPVVYPVAGGEVADEARQIWGKRRANLAAGDVYGKNFGGEKSEERRGMVGKDDEEPEESGLETGDLFAHSFGSARSGSS